MTAIAQVDFTQIFQDALARVINIVPTILAFLVILIVGYIIVRLLAKAIDAVLERVGFDRAVERGGVGRALERTEYDASDIVSRIVFYALMLFVLQLAFGVFGPNPVSDLLAGVIAFLPQLFVAIIIIVVASAIAAAVRELILASLGGLAYGRILGAAAAAAIVAIGAFAALNQLQVAPAIVTGLFYAVLAIIAGSAIIAIGGGGITPMRRQWERALGRLEEEAPKMREQVAQTGPEEVRARADQRRAEYEGAGTAPGNGGRGNGGGARRPDEDTTIRTEAEEARPPGRRPGEG